MSADETVQSSATDKETQKKRRDFSKEHGHKPDDYFVDRDTLGFRLIANADELLEQIERKVLIYRNEYKHEHSMLVVTSAVATQLLTNIFGESKPELTRQEFLFNPRYNVSEFGGSLFLLKCIEAGATDVERIERIDANVGVFRHSQDVDSEIHILHMTLKKTH